MFDYGEGVETSVVGLPVGPKCSEYDNQNHLMALFDHLCFFTNVEPDEYADPISLNRNDTMKDIREVNSYLDRPVPSEAIDSCLRSFLQWGLNPDILDLSVQLGQAVVEEDYEAARVLHDQLESLKWYRSAYKEQLLAELQSSPCQN